MKLYSDKIQDARVFEICHMRSIFEYLMSSVDSKFVFFVVSKGRPRTYA